jgi:WD40 repeat protein/TolB-like protein
MARSYMKIGIFLSLLLLLLPSNAFTQTGSITYRPYFEFIGHKSEVLSVAFSLDGRILASCSKDKTIRLWDVDKKKELKSLTGHKMGVNCIAFSPNGLLLASGGNDKKVIVWNLEKGTEEKVFTGHKRKVLAVAFSADGSLLASAGEDKIVKLWDLSTGYELGELKGHGKAVHSIAFHPDGRSITTGSQDKSMRTWEITSRKEIRSLTESAARYGELLTFDFSPEGRMIASAIKEVTRAMPGKGAARGGIKENDFVQLRDGMTGKDLGKLEGHLESVVSISFSPDGRFLATGSYDHSVRLWDIKKLEEIATIPLKGRAYSVDFSPDGRWLTAGTGDNKVWVWSLKGVSSTPLLIAGEGRYQPPALFLPPFSGEKRYVAVVDLRTKGNVSPDTASILSDSLRNELIKTGRFNVIDRNNMELIIKEQARQLSDFISEESTVEFGKILGVKEILTGSVSKIGKIYSISIKLTSVGTGQIKESAEERCPCAEEDLFLTVGTVAKKLIMSK